MDSSPSSSLSWLTARQLYASAAAPMFCPTFNLHDSHSIDDDMESNAIELSGDMEIPKQPLFEKPLTPSDVGKLNRLVIPKQHAEKCFPLNGGGGESADNGLLLSFEDELGKSWRFRYSYWNSSQSYVLTKGWSRFVKEKRLDAGDIVVFSRHRADAGRLFIGWRRRNSIGGDDLLNLCHPTAVGGWNRIPAAPAGNPCRNHHHQLGQSNLQHHCPHAGSVVESQTAASASVSGNSKRLRLFGVNLECQAAVEDSHQPATPVGSPVSTQSQHNHYSYHRQYYPNPHLETTFSGGDTYRQG